MQFLVLWSGLVSRVSASHRVNLIAPFSLGQNCPRKISMTMTMTMTMTMNKLEGYQDSQKHHSMNKLEG